MGETTISNQQPRRLQVAIVDGPNEKEHDINGDGVPDFSHAEMMEAFVKAGNPRADVTPYLASSIKTIPELVSPWKKLQADIKGGKKYDAVIFSIQSPLAFSRVTDKKGNPLTPENIGTKREAFSQKPFLDLLTWGNRTTEEQVLSEGKKINRIIEAVNKHAPVYVAGGNDGADHFNAFNLAQGGYHLGAKNKQGKVEPYSADNSLLTHYGPGSFTISQVRGGYDIDGNGTADITENDTRLSKGQPLVDRFVGRNILTTVVSDMQFDAVKSNLRADSNGVVIGTLTPEVNALRENKLFSLKQLEAVGILTPELKKTWGHYGDYVHLGGAAMTFGFRKDASGHIVYNPLNLPAKDIKGKPVSLTFGTSNVGPYLVGRSDVGHFTKRERDKP